MGIVSAIESLKKWIDSFIDKSDMFTKQLNEKVSNHERSKDCNILIVRLLNNQNIKNGIVQTAIFAKYRMSMCAFSSNTVT
jgi:hypothetical protein